MADALAKKGALAGSVGEDKDGGSDIESSSSRNDDDSSRR
jgi:hypothetical protein